MINRSYIYKYNKIKDETKVNRTAPDGDNDGVSDDESPSSSLDTRTNTTASEGNDCDITPESKFG